MVFSWLERKKQESGEWTGFLEQGVYVEGRIEAEGTFRIDSSFKGTIVSRDALILGEHALVDGEISGQLVQIAGRFTGKISARSRVLIQPTAVVTGDIETPCLLVEPGGVFDGRCLVPKIDESLAPLAIPVRSISLPAEAAGS